MKKLLLISFIFLLSACSQKTTLEGTYENEEGKGLMHLAFTFKPNGTVTIKDFAHLDKAQEEHPYKIEADKVQIQSFFMPLTRFNDGSLDGNILGVFKKK